MGGISSACKGKGSVLADTGTRDRNGAVGGKPSKQRLKDIAEIANVSISTVSRALNNSPLVNTETRERVQAIARSARYKGPNRDHRYDDPPGTLSVIVPPPHGRDPGFSEPFLLELLGGLADAAREKGCDLRLSHEMPSDTDRLADIVADGRSEGLILLGQCNLHQGLNVLAGRGVPLVVWGARMADQRYCSVGSDNFQGGQRATEHLIRLGRRRIAFLGETEAPEAMLRFEGYRAALERAGIPFDPELFRPAQFYLESGMESVEALLGMDRKIDGLVTASDIIAMGAIRGLERQGLRVPEDVSVVGYDDIQLSRYASPALTTIRQDVSAAGRTMIAKLNLLRENRSAAPEQLPPHLIVRDSCGA